MKTHDQKLAELRADSAQLAARRETEFAAKDSRRLDALLTLDIDVMPADGVGWVLVDWRTNPPRTTEHASGRDAIDAALANVQAEPRGPQP